MRGFEYQDRGQFGKNIKHNNEINLQQQNMLSKHIRKRKKKRDKLMCRLLNHSHSFHHQLLLLPRIMKFALLFTLSTLFIFNFVKSQLILDHPKTRIFKSPSSHQDSNHIFSSESNPLTNGQNNHENQLLKQNITHSQVLNRTDSPSSNVEHNQILRKLSSTMLIENLLRHPYPSIKSRFPFLLPFSSHPLNYDSESPLIDLLFDTRSTTTQVTNSKKIKLHDKKQPIKATSTMDVSTTNIANAITRKNDTSNGQTSNSLSSKDSFNPRSLTYLVDKLLSMDSSKQDNPLRQIQKRPSPRPTSAHNQPLKSHANNISYNVKSQTPTSTLDMLIKDEYDSRVKPMIKLLNDQRKLSTDKLPDTTPSSQMATNAVPVNHKLDEVITGSEATTTLTMNEIPNRQATTPTSSFNLDSSRPNLDEQINYDDIESDTEDHEDSDEYEDDSKDADKNDSRTKQSTSTVKLRNVPPYQLGTSFVHVSPSPTKSERATAESAMIESSSKAKGTTHKSGPVVGEKTADASTRGSLVFSDGGDEAERANRRRMQFGDNGDSSSVKNSNSKSLTKSDKLGDSFLLNQLFSTVDPLIDMNIKLREHSTGSRDSDEQVSNPLIYKGYVGKDDYLLSTTASDWSRPIGNSRDTSPTIYKYLYPNMPTKTTPAPPTELPTVPYNYFLHQPVTNAQSVPSMVIPPSDPPEVSTQAPLPSIEPSGRLVPSQNHKIRIANPFSEYSIHHNNSTSQLPAEKLPKIIVHDKKYSYQIPDKQSNTQVHQTPSANHSVLSQSTGSSKSPTVQLSESEPDSKSKVSEASSRLGNTTDNSWSPTKAQNPQNNLKRQQPPLMNSTDLLLNSDKNSSSSMSFPIVEANSRPSTMNDKNLITLSESDQGETEYNSSLVPRRKLHASKTFINEFSSHNESNHEPDDGFSHVKPKFNPQRNKSKNSNSITKSRINVTDQASKSAEGDERYENANRFSPDNGRIKLSQSDHIRPDVNEMDNADTSQDSPSEGGNGENYSGENDTAKKKNRAPNGTKIINGQAILEDEESSGNVLKNRLRKINKYFSNEPAGSEISSTGLESNQKINKQGLNQTSRFVQFKQPIRTTETILISGSDGPYSIPSGNLDQPGPTHYGSTIIPHSSFFGEASSERPVLDSSISLLGEVSGKANKIDQHPGIIVPIDPYQHISSNTVLSTIQQPFSTTSVPTTTPKLQTSTTQVSSAKEQSDETGNNGQNPVKPPTRPAFDRWTYILIGGSSVISVGCLILAISMRRQDMRDDYQSLRNAERAALKLRKHRLKYTKNHQINRYNRGPGSAESGQSLIDDLNLGNGNSFIDAEINHARNSRFQNNTKSIQFLDAVCKNNNADQLHHVWNQNCYLPISDFANGKENQACGCDNANHRWLCSDDLMAGNKNLSWLHPYYYMQQHSRLRPLFGAGSSVGTFFPRRHDEQRFRSGGSVDAQILMDSQPAHSCTMADQKAGVMRSKSIMFDGKNHSTRHANGLETSCAVRNSGCNNPEHNHTHHICHNHHHHKCHHHETSASDESELTLDEAIHCDNAQCSSNHGNRLKVTQLAKLNSQLSSGWKKQQAAQGRKAGAIKHLHNHQTTSSDSSSLAQCTCSRDHQPLLSAHTARLQSSQNTSHKHLNKVDLRTSLKQRAKRDKSMLIWSTNRDRLI